MMEFLKEPVNLRSKKHFASVASLAVVLFLLISIPLTVIALRTDRPTSPKAATGSCLSWAGQCIFVTSIDTMKLSKDMETGNLTDAQIDNAVAASAQQNPTHITIVTHYDYSDLMYRWVKSIRAHGKKVWFRAGIKGWGNGTITPAQWLQTYQTFLQTYVGNPSYPNFFVKGDVFDPNAETENGYTVYCGCSLYGGTSWTTAFNQFLIDQTTTADSVFAAKGFTQGTTNATRDILTTVHSVDPGSSTGVLNSQFVTAMDNLVTVDAYPDQNDTDPTTAANDWLKQIGQINSKWPTAKILLGEMGYSNTINVTDSQQQSVLAAEMSAFSTTTYPMVGMNYWVGPGSATAGGYTYIFTGSVSSGWTARPGAAFVSDFYKAKAGGTPSLSVTTTSPSSGATVSGTVDVAASVNLTVTKVEFYVDGSLNNTSTTSPYSFSWDSKSVADGAHTLSDKAYDSAGNVATSSPVSVTVANASKTSLWCEAENGSLVSPMIKGSDTAASNGGYIYTTVTDSTNVPPTTTGSATLTVNVPVAGTYTFWTRVNYTGEFQNSYYLQVDGGNTFYEAGNENTDYGVWKWVNWQNGATGTTNIITLNFATAGNHTLKIIGREANTLIDKILLTNDPAYVPSGIGNADNCSGGSGGDTTAPTVNITSPTNGSNVSGPVSVVASASDNVGVTKVELYADGVLVGTDTASPYNFTWSSTSVTNGSHTLSAKAYDAAGKVGISANDVVSVANGDTTRPSTPTNLTATAASATKVNLSWTASTDNVGVTGYYIVRSGVTIATASTNSFSDTTVSPSTNYSYYVFAYDAALNNSGASNTVSVPTPALPDTTPPTAPTNLTTTVVSSSQINLSWTAATDNVGVVGYDIYRNSTKLTSVGTVTSFGNTALTASTSYSYYVIAKDAAGNPSAASNTVTAVTQAPPATTGAITGTVSSSLGGSLAYASITISVNGSNQTYTANSSGGYIISNLAPSTYSVKYSAKHYITQTQTVSVTANTAVTKNVTLQKR